MKNSKIIPNSNFNFLVFYVASLFNSHYKDIYKKNAPWVRFVAHHGAI